MTPRPTEFLIVWALVVYGTTTIVTTSKIFSPFRDLFPTADEEHPLTWRNAFGTLIQCPMCFGFWVGLGLSLVGFTPVPQLLDLGWWPSRVLQVVASGAAGTALAWSWYLVLERLKR